MIKAYQRFARDGLGTGHQKKYYEVKEQRYLGDEKFLETVCRRVDEQEQVYSVRITMEEIVAGLAKETGISVRVLLGRC